jgi:hypothetical protein
MGLANRDVVSMKRFIDSSAFLSPLPLEFWGLSAINHILSLYE